MGTHLILDFSCKDKNMADRKHIYRFLNSIVKSINMRKLIEPIVKLGKPYLPGVSGIIMIETSHCAIHTFTKENRIMVDVYSCKDFSEEIVFYNLNKYFNGLNLLNNHLLRREDGQ